MCFVAYWIGVYWRLCCLDLFARFGLFWIVGCGVVLVDVGCWLSVLFIAVNSVGIGFSL